MKHLLTRIAPFRSVVRNSLRHDSRYPRHREYQYDQRADRLKEFGIADTVPGFPGFPGFLLNGNLRQIPRRVPGVRNRRAVAPRRLRQSIESIDRKSTRLN